MIFESTNPEKLQNICNPGNCHRRSRSLPDNLTKLDSYNNFLEINENEDTYSQEGVGQGYTDLWNRHIRHSRSLSSISALSYETYQEAEAVWDHITLESGELCFKAGDKIFVEQLSNSDWWKGRKDSIHEGWFPSCFVRICANQYSKHSEHSWLSKNHVKEIYTEDVARSNVLKEILSAERHYVQHLKDVVEGYIKPSRQHKVLFSEEQISIIFLNIEDIFKFSESFLRQLEDCYNFANISQSCIGHCFVKNAPNFHVYSAYCSSHAHSLEVLQRLYRNKKYRHFFEGCRLLRDMIEIPLEGFLLKPVQKICKYPLQLSELLKYTDVNHADYSNLTTALDTMKSTANSINNHKRKLENMESISIWQRSVEDWKGPDLLEHSTELIYSGLVNKLNPKGWWQQRHLFLFDHQIIYCKKDILKKNTFTYKGRIKLDNSKVVSIQDGRDVELNCHMRHAWKVFEHDRMRCFTFSVKSNSDKDQWLHAFKEERQLVFNDNINGIKIPPEVIIPYRRSQKNKHKHGYNVIDMNKLKL